MKIFACAFLLLLASAFAQEKDNATDAVSDAPATPGNDTAVASGEPIKRRPGGRNATIEEPGPGSPTLRTEVARPAHNLSFVQNRSEVTNVFASRGFGRADLWFNFTELTILYRQRFPYVNRSASNDSLEQPPSDIEDSARTNLDDLDKLLNDLNASVIESSGLQFFPIMTSPPMESDFLRAPLRSRSPDSRMSPKMPGASPETASAPAFVHPALERMRMQRMQRASQRRSLPPLFEQPDWDEPAEPERPPTIEGTEAFANYRVIVPLSRFGDLTQNLNRFNSSITSIRLVASKAAKSAAKQAALRTAVDNALEKADSAFGALGVNYKGMYDFRVMNSRIPYLPAVPVNRGAKLPKLRAVRIPVFARVILLLSY